MNTTHNGQIEFLVPGIVCEGCAASIKNALSGTAGVQDVKVDIAQKNVTIGYEGDISAEVFAEKLREAGFSPQIS